MGQTIKSASIVQLLDYFMIIMRSSDPFGCENFFKRLKYGSMVILFIIAIANVVIGALYRDDCRFAVPTYLMAAGGGTLTFIGLWTIAKCTGKDIIVKTVWPTAAQTVWPIIFLALVGTVIWG